MMGVIWWESNGRNELVVDIECGGRWKEEKKEKNKV